MAEDTNSAGGVPNPNQGQGGDGTTNIFTKLTAKTNALKAARRNSAKKLENKKKEFNDKKAKFLKFIADMLTVLGIVELFFLSINNFFAKGKRYETKLKRTLIDCFNANIACNLDDIFKSNDVNPNPFFVLNISKIDFFGLLKIDPNSKAGKTFFESSSNDTLNRAIKTAIDSNTRQNWRDLLYIELDPNDPNRNTLLFYVDNYYLNKPYSAFINDLVNQINLIPNTRLLLNVMDNIYGSFSYSIQPRKIDFASLLNRSILNKYIDKILDGGEDLIIDESFFSFTNEELAEIDKLTQNLNNNFLQVISCNNVESVVEPNDLYPILDQIVSAGTYNEEITVIEAGMTTLQAIASRNVSKTDFPKFKLEFYFNIFNQLTNSLVGLVYQPQFLIIMMIYFKLANTNPTSPEPIVYEDFKDFLKKTRKILLCVVWSIFKLILLLVVIPLIIKELVSEANKERFERNKEKYELFVAQYLAAKGLLDIVKNNTLLQQIMSSV